MVTINKVKNNLRWFLDYTLSNWETANTEKSGEIKNLLNETTFLNVIGLRAFSKFKINDEDLNNFLGKFKQADIERIREIKEYLGSKEDNDYEIKWEEIKRLLTQELKSTIKYINQFNMNVLLNNLTYRDYQKRYYAIINAKKVERSEDIEYNPTIVINKSVALMDLEKIKEENYKVLEETKFFAANDDLLLKKVEVEEDNDIGPDNE